MEFGDFCDSTPPEFVSGRQVFMFVGKKFTGGRRRMLRHLMAGCFALLSISFGSGAKLGRGGWARTPLAVGALSGLRFIHVRINDAFMGRQNCGLPLLPNCLMTAARGEPYLLEFHGANCDHCEAMLPLFERLFQETRLVVKRHMVWLDTANFRLMKIYDMKTNCDGLPFFYNRRTGQTICGATTYSNFRDWALDRECETFLPPRVSPEAEDGKPKKLEQESLFKRLKSRTRGGEKEPPAKLDEYE